MSFSVIRQFNALESRVNASIKYACSFRYAKRHFSSPSSITTLCKKYRKPHSRVLLARNALVASNSDVLSSRNYENHHCVFYSLNAFVSSERFLSTSSILQVDLKPPSKVGETVTALEEVKKQDKSSNVKNSESGHDEKKTDESVRKLAENYEDQMIVEYSEHLRQSYHDIEEILNELNFKYGTNPNADIVLRDLATHIRRNGIVKDENTVLKKNLRTMKVLRYRCTARAEIDRLESLYGLDVQFDKAIINKIKDPVAKSKEYRFQRWVHMGKAGAITSNERFYSKLLLHYTEEDIARLMADAYHLLSESIKDISLEGIEGNHCKHHLTIKTDVNEVLDLLLENFDFNVGKLE